MSDNKKKSFTGWVERPLWERTAIVLLLTVSIVGLLIAYGEAST